MSSTRSSGVAAWRRCGEKELSHANDTPVFLPFLFGERCPGWNEKRCGGFLSVKPEHTVYNLYQSVLEGVVFSVYHCYEILADTAGYPKLIKLSGGILHSEFWMQICASLFDVPMMIDESNQSSVMGCAISREIGRASCRERV